MYDITLVILNYNNANDTIILCNSLLKQKEINFCILIIDNCSTNDSFDTITKSLKDKEQIEILKSESNAGYATGNNYGLKFISQRIKTKYVAILNNDLTIKDNELFSKLINKYKTLDDVGFIAAMQKDQFDNPYPNSAWRKPTFIQDCLMSFWLYRKFFKANKYDFNNNEKIEKVEILPGCFLLSTFEYFKELDYFDEGTFLFLEERILFDKVKNNNNNKQNYLIKDLYYYHEASSTIDKEFSNISKYKILYDSLIYYTKNYRNNPSLKLLILKPLLGYSLFELKIMGLLKKLRKNKS